MDPHKFIVSETQHKNCYYFANIVTKPTSNYQINRVVIKAHNFNKIGIYKRLVCFSLQFVPNYRVRTAREV